MGVLARTGVLRAQVSSSLQEEGTTHEFSHEGTPRQRQAAVDEHHTWVEGSFLPGYPGTTTPAGRLGVSSCVRYATALFAALFVRAQQITP